MDRLGGLLVATLMSTLVGAGCNDTAFKSQNPRKAEAQTARDPKKSDAALKLLCEGGKGEARLVTDLKGSEATSVRLEGEFCGIPDGSASAKLTMLFVLDVSGSMRDNDPLVGDSCGRLAAGIAIVNKLEQELRDGVEINVGLLAFGSQALPLVEPQPLASFKTQLTSATLCRDDGRGTNYEAAFAGAKDALDDVEGNKAVYFISDGLPTESGTGILTGLGGFGDAKAIYEAGAKAAAELRGLPDLTLNTIFLGAGSGTGGLDTAGYDAQSYLEEITGDKDRVRLVTSADDLAAEIVKFDTPEAVTLDKDSVSATVSAPAFGKTPIKVASLEPAPGRDGVWTFVTEPFTLFGTKQKAVANEVVLTVKGGDGKDYRATAVINFAVEDE